MVYDATKSGINDSVWAPWFPIPTIYSHLWAVEAETYIGDYDVGEMFLNFMLYPVLRPHAGVDLSLLFHEETSLLNPILKGYWERMLMVFGLAPNFVTKDMLVVEMIIKENRFDKKECV